MYTVESCFCPQNMPAVSWRVLSIAEKEGFFKFGRRTFCGKNKIFQKVWCVRTDKGGGLGQGGHFAYRGRDRRSILRYNAALIETKF